MANFLSASLSIGPLCTRDLTVPLCVLIRYFKLYHIVARVEKFKQAMATSKHAADDVVKHFPFTKFFATAPNQPILRGESFEADLKAAEGCFRHIEHVFDELKDYQPFELLRSSRQRSDYLLSKQARIIAMTCTHAALIRSRLVELGFKFDNIVMEEAAQILEIETLIPILLQTQDNTAQSAEERKSRLKRVVLIGDHHQLPPVVKNMVRVALPIRCPSLTTLKLTNMCVPGFPKIWSPGPVFVRPIC